MLTSASYEYVRATYVEFTIAIRLGITNVRIFEPFLLAFLNFQPLIFSQIEKLKFRIDMEKYCSIESIRLKEKKIRRILKGRIRPSFTRNEKWKERKGKKVKREDNSLV